MLKLWNWLLSAEHHAVDNILADFHSVVDRLKASAEKHYDDAMKAAGLADYYKAAEEAAAAEAERAKTIAMSITALVGAKSV